MRSVTARALDPARFRVLLGLVFLGLAVPAAVLLRHAFAQLELDAFRRDQLAAEQVLRRADAEIAAAIEIEQARGIDDYGFYTGAAEPATGALRRSPLSAHPPSGALPGTIGYFEVDRAGTLTTPLLPAPADGAIEHGLTAPERDARRALETRIASVLAANRLVRAGSAQARVDADTAIERREAEASTGAQARARARPAAEASAEQAAPFRTTLADDAGGPDRDSAPRAGSPREEDGGARGQAAFDELSARPLGIAEIVVTGSRISRDAVRDEAADVEQAATLAEPAADSRPAPDRAATIVQTFEVDVEPFRFSRLDAAHFVLFRNAWRGEERYVQGLLLDADAFLGTAIGDAFEQSALAPGTALTVSAGGDVLARLPAAPRTGTPRGALPPSDGAVRAGTSLLTARLSPPLAEVELAFAAGDLPRGAAHSVLVWTGIALFGVLVGGFAVVYRFGTEQIELVRQQQNFVSAVSHELKTPLTSIRMYGEMLRSGWAGEERKQAYYDFIYAEGERLSRLIDNVLELARLSRGGPAVSLEAISVEECVEMARAKLATQLEQAGVVLETEIEAGARGASVAADADALAQVFINLVDNAIKFARDAARRDIVLAVSADAAERITFAVRDFGPGLPPGEAGRLFRLFYRPDNELTRRTSGTGIGLALVRQLVTAMGGAVDVRNCDPGAEFRITLRRAAGAARPPYGGS